MISVTILVKNSARTLAKTLASLEGFPEVVVYDTGSTDGTAALAAAFPNVRFFTGPFEGFGPTHNRASSLAAHDWILSLDSDEELSSTLAQELLSLSLATDTVYQIERHNYFQGKWIRGCAGWYPDWVTRLYNRTATRFSDDLVHERVLAEGVRKAKLMGKIVHTPYLEIQDLLGKMQHYTTLYATGHRKLKTSSVWGALLRGWAAFIKSYFLKAGFRAGSQGLILSLYNAHTTYYKYLKLSE